MYAHEQQSRYRAAELRRQAEQHRLARAAKAARRSGRDERADYRSQWVKAA
ncbi:hypothetical protein SRB5_22800 [Streptomyces sp. RB5]|uniref:Uncharacterized protein n=1 Tax=Streptomyces smaragdinus TaxID=2585196 RepID=A0A7K0CFA4_9ACTN|nr:hypothetical protein [Streptomyces smaragdinus]MQY12150.1 hypothetical protein [Streptomyces smaragdinus]